ncbi:MAG: GNAT family N-acetyltransferase [Pirellulales bacterium]|nr:GNAT family N-acetyltransferase [Pirellulales bacterium]
MPNTTLLRLTGVDDLRNAAAAWDDLWWRSDVTLPTVRAELLAQWLEQFGGSEPFHALVVKEDSGRWVAALPLVSRRLAGVFRAGTLPCNPWLPCGDLLVDPAADVPAALETLLAGAAALPWPLLWMNEAVIDSVRWQALHRAAARLRMPTAEHVRYPVARIPIAVDWGQFLKDLSRAHRQATNKAVRRLHEMGDLRLKRLTRLDPDEVQPWLEKVFAVEDSSWKGSAGSSVLREPGMCDFYLRQARQLAAWGQLEIAVLNLEGKAIAAMFGFSAKGVLHAHKIGYDPQFASSSPGQVMFWMILEQMHLEKDWRAIDCIGPLTEAISRWRPDTYALGRLAIAPGRFTGRAALKLYQRVWPWVRRVRPRPSRASSPAPPAEVPMCEAVR